MIPIDHFITIPLQTLGWKLDISILLQLEQEYLNMKPSNPFPGFIWGIPQEVKHSTLKLALAQQETSYKTTPKAHVP